MIIVSVDGFCEPQAICLSQFRVLWGVDSVDLQMLQFWFRIECIPVRKSEIGQPKLYPS